MAVKAFAALITDHLERITTHTLFNLDEVKLVLPQTGRVTLLNAYDSFDEWSPVSSFILKGVYFLNMRSILSF